MEDEVIHSHCVNCIKIRKCNSRPEPGISCEIISCHLYCGSSFHACKREEHKLLCLNERVPCINVHYGCPFTMARKNQAKHLSVCPASVIHCTMEWNPWHLDVHRERKLLFSNDGLQQHHLDVALAMRDLRVLHQWYMANRSKRRAPKHSFKYPRPLLVYKMPHPSENAQVCDEDAKSEICESSQSCDMNSQPDELFHSALKYSNQSENKENINNTNYLNKKCDNSLNLINGRTPVYGKEIKGNAYFFYENWDSLDNSYLMDDDEDDVSDDFILKINSDCDLLSFKELALSSVAPSTWFTFLCCQEFRRDECTWHYKNVHSEIKAGLHGWLQERCPLAQYGCTFSRERLNPAPKGSKIVFNEVIDGFGFKPPESVQSTQPNSDKIFNMFESPNEKEKNSHSRIHITELPFEILQHIAQFLDSFSLFNLSLTCHLMRSVCQSLLEERGIVVLQWQKVKSAATSKWKVVGKKWFFSAHFTPVKEWHFCEDFNMLNHMKTCTYFNQNLKSDPYYYPMGIEPSESTYKKLKDGVELTKYIRENITTKL